MIHRRLSMFTILTLALLVSQFAPFGNNVHVAAAESCNSAGFIADVTVPDGSVFQSGGGFVKTWRLKNTGTCAWTSSYGLAFVSGDPLGATSSRPMPSIAPGQQVDVSLDMNAPITPGHYRGYWMLKDAQGNKFGLGTNADRSFWVDINVAGGPTSTVAPGANGIIFQGTVRRNSVGVAGVRIYYGDHYPGPGSGTVEPDYGELIATTDKNGKYSKFVPIPGDYERVTVWAELDGYAFEPVIHSWFHKAGLETKTLDFTAAPGAPGPFPGPGAALDFAYQASEATWTSGAGTLTYPGTEGDARGFVRQLQDTTFEDGFVDGGPNLLVSPQNIYNGFIQGTYPAYIVQKGDRFRTSVGCAYGYGCYAIFRLMYRIDNGPIYTFWSWTEKNEGQVYSLDRDISLLAGRKVTFILTLLANGSAARDRAIWGHPRIVHTDLSAPTPVTPSPTTVTPAPTIVTPSVTAPPPPAGVLLDFSSAVCTANWKSSVGALPCPMTEGDSRGFALPVDNPKLEDGSLDNTSGLILFPQNKYNGYIQGTYPEVITVQKGDRFQGIVGCAYGSSCYVTFRLDYQLENGLQVKYWTWAEKNEGKYYRVDKDLSALAGKKVKFILMLLATGPATNDRAVWSQPRIVRPGLVSPTPSPTDTPIPQGNVTEVKASVKVPEFVNCAGALNVELLGNITTNGPATVKYHWEINGTQVMAESTLVFSSASTQSANIDAYPVNCGNYVAKLLVTSPNAITAESSFSLSVPTVLPIYDFNTFKVIGTMGCTEVVNYAWRQEACNGESGGCWISTTPLFGNSYAGFFRHDGNTICGLNIP